ncbi:DUF2663 family protein [Risungbinella massiliensis]|uniref:DUF2663 family protein n=1 Tax=Risungbinella massiliensis TaxID=1329796 RepID=UPI0011C85AC4
MVVLLPFCFTNSGLHTYVILTLLFSYFNIQIDLSQKRHKKRPSFFELKRSIIETSIDLLPHTYW